MERTTVRSAVRASSRPGTPKDAVNNSNEIKLLEKLMKMSETSVDLKLTLYLAAKEGAAALTPAPPETGVDEETALEAHQAIPPAPLLAHYLQMAPNACPLPQGTKDLLFWNLVYLKEPRLVPVKKDLWREILRKAGSEAPFPCHLFKLMYSSTSTLEMKWQAIIQKNPNAVREFGYFTSQVSNFHSLIHNGIEGSGGVVVWRDSTACLGSAQPSWVWGKSSLGLNLTLIAIAEYLYNPSSPPKEIDPYSVLVGTPQHVRIRYLLVYVNRGAKKLEVTKVVKERNVRKAIFGLALLTAVILFKSRSQPLNRITNSSASLLSDTKDLIVGLMTAG